MKLLLQACVSQPEREPNILKHGAISAVAFSLLVKIKRDK